MWIFPFIMVIVMLFVVFMVFGRGGFRPPWNYNNQGYYQNKQNETPLDILKKRYANGEISKEEFDKIKKDIL
ncbi:MAG: SHOCT domain-containing protein [Chlorobi bacterium]|nr:SHOCT domain-containing protein [Chlorobiota bacterium]